MSTNTIVREIIAEHNEKQRKQQPPTPKEIQARMVEMINAANGLRYEVARFGDIERQLKAVHEKMEPLVLKAKELNDLVCERVSQASQPWANSCIHDAEELMQKVQQLERENARLQMELDASCNAEELRQVRAENAALRRDVYLCSPTSENGYEGLKWADAFEVIERDNAELHNKLAALQHQSQWQCSCGGTDCEGMKENAELRADVYCCPPTTENDYEGFKWRDAHEELERENAKLRGELEEARFERDEVKRVRYSLEDALTRSQAEAEACWVKKDELARAAEEVLRTYINVVRVTGHPCPEDLVICRQLRAAIDAARGKEAKP